MDRTRRKATPEQLSMLLHFLEQNKELAIGNVTGLEGKIRQTRSWIKISEKLNAGSDVGSGAVKTPAKWRQAWRDWRNNAKKKAFKIRTDSLTPGCNTNAQLTDAEEKILKLICPNNSESGTPETSVVTNSMASSQSNVTTEDFDPSTGKWHSDPLHITKVEPDMVPQEDMLTDTDAANEVPSAPVRDKPLWKKGRPIRPVHDRLLNLEEEKIRIEKQKLLEKKRSNNIRHKLERERLEIEKQRNLLLGKLLVAVEALVQQ